MVIGIKCSPLILITVVIGAVLLVVILGLNAYLFSFGIALNGMKV
jgi:hypothetical protein